jgi:hypothetical protein
MSQVFFVSFSVHEPGKGMAQVRVTLGRVKHGTSHALIDKTRPLQVVCRYVRDLRHQNLRSSASAKRGKYGKLVHLQAFYIEKCSQSVSEIPVWHVG